MTPAEQQKLDETSKIAKRQADELARQIEDALTESGFDSDYYGEIRGMIYRFVAFGQQQMEERLSLYEIIRNASNQ